MPGKPDGRGTVVSRQFWKGFSQSFLTQDGVSLRTHYRGPALPFTDLLQRSEPVGKIHEAYWLHT